MNTQHDKVEFDKFKPLIKNAIKNGECSSNDVFYGIGYNTFRGLRGYKNKPSETYRSWAEERTKSILKNRTTVANQKSFNKWHSLLCVSLEKHWKKVETKQLVFAHKYHLVDLYLKWLCANINWLWTNDEWKKENSKWLKTNKKYLTRTNKLSNQIFNFGYCPLDSKALEAINDFLPNALLKKEQTLKSIYDKNVYLCRQSLIRDIVKLDGSTPLMFDFYVWPPARRWLWLPTSARKKILTL